MTETQDNGTKNSSKRYGQGDGSKNKKDFTFRGKTPEMQGKVFQVHGEPRKRGEFKSTLEALERYAGRFYPLDTAALQTLFKDLIKPKIEPPKPPGERLNDDDAVKVEDDSDSEEISE